MNSIQERALFQLTGTKKMVDVTEENLLQLVNDYPYFAPAQLLYTAKLKAVAASNFVHQAQKTNLYFTNPYWLHYQLVDFQNEPKQLTAIDPNWIAEIAQPETIVALPAPIAETIVPVVTKSNSIADIAIPTMESVLEMMRNINQQPLPETVIEPETDIAAPMLQTEAIIAPLPSIIEATGHFTQVINEPYEEEAATELSNSKIASLLSSQLAEFKKPLAETDALEISREPLHTIDYFASQGIKIDLSKIPQDKLTTHLRRFTDWLKYMKTDNPDPIDLGTHQDLAEAVDLIAHSSNEQKEIVTETMAEVFIKQGQVDKAIQLYIKLSFLNPEKSTYFAGRIQHLKGIQ